MRKPHPQKLFLGASTIKTSSTVGSFDLLLFIMEFCGTQLAISKRTVYTRILVSGSLLSQNTFITAYNCMKAVVWIWNLVALPLWAKHLCLHETGSPLSFLNIFIFLLTLWKILTTHYHWFYLLWTEFKLLVKNVIKFTI